MDSGYRTAWQCSEQSLRAGRLPGQGRCCLLPTPRAALAKRDLWSQATAGTCSAVSLA